MEKRYRMTLTEEEREKLEGMVSTGKAAARKLLCARVLLLANQAEAGQPFYLSIHFRFLEKAVKIRLT